MSKIRDDLEGVVHLQTEDGVVVLKAGDTVPSGVEVGEHLTKSAPKSESADKDDDGAGGKSGRSRSTRS